MVRRSTINIYWCIDCRSVGRSSVKSHPLYIHELQKLSSVGISPREGTAGSPRSMRVIGGITISVAKDDFELHDIVPGVILIGEVDEFLESHALTVLSPNSKRSFSSEITNSCAKYSNHAISVEKGDDG